MILGPCCELTCRLLLNWMAEQRAQLGQETMTITGTNTCKECAQTFTASKTRGDVYLRLTAGLASTSAGGSGSGPRSR